MLDVRQYTTKDKLIGDMKSYASELMHADKEILAEIKSREREIQNSDVSRSSKEYGMKLLQKVSYKQEQISRAHDIQFNALDISCKLMNYANRIESINEKYASSIATFQNTFDLKKVVDIETREIARIKELMGSIEKITEELPSFDDLTLKIVA